MQRSAPPPAVVRSAGRSRWETAGYVAFAVLVAAVVLRLCLAPDPARNNVSLKVFVPAARAFLDGRDLYPVADGFRWPPVCALLFVPFAACGPVLGSVLWRLLGAAVLLAGARALFRAQWPLAWTSASRGVFLLVLAASSAISVNNGQANALILGLLLLAGAGVVGGRAAAPGAAVAAAAAIKVYPLAYGLLLGLLRPRVLAWLLLFLSAAAAAPFAFADADYVVASYRRLAEVLAAEDRTRDLAIAYRDVRLVAAAAGVPIGDGAFRALQVLGGAGIAALVLLLRRRADERAAGEAALSLVLCWFLLLGPATEKASYAWLGPPAAFALLRAARARSVAWLWVTGTALALMVTGSLSVFEPERAGQAAHPWLRCPLPVAAILVTAATLAQAAAAARIRPGVRAAEART